MLVLRLREGEAILIGPDIRIEYVERCGNQARIGVEAPRELKVLRQELLTKAKATK